MKKIAFGSSILVLSLLAACSSSNTQGSVSDTSSIGDQSSIMQQDQTSSDAGVTFDISSQQAQTASTSSVADQQTSQQATNDASTNVITVQVASFQYTPNMIVAKKGQKTQIKLVGVSGNHGFAVPELGINVRVSAGDTVVVDLPTDKVGTFQAFCSVPCGPGHKDMKATVVVE